MNSPRTSLPVLGKISDVTLSKSVQLLDEALNSPAKSMLRTAKGTPMRRSLLSKKDSSAVESSILQAVSGTPLRGTFNDWSLTMDPIEYEENTMTTGTLIPGQDPWKMGTDALFMEFLESMQSHSSEQQVFDTVTDFIQNCSNALDVFKHMNYKLPSGDDLNRCLALEHATWHLVYCLYQNRLSSQRNGNLEVDSGMQLTYARHLSEKEVVIELYKNDSLTRECQLVVDWLEQDAGRQVEGLPNVQHYTDKTVAWENTLHQLQNKERNIPYHSSRPILNKLDPDAPLREGKPLHDLDEEDEVKLTSGVFMEIRCGRLEEAQNLCVHCGQPWRAAVLEGWRLYHDPNFGEHVHNGEKLPVEGNPNRDLWKLMAWRLSSDLRMPPYSRATHAALCGHLEALEGVCTSWPDLLWAYLRVMVDIRVEKELRSTLSRSYIPMPEEYWKNQYSLEEVFIRLSANSNPVIREDAMSPIRLLQKYLILDQIPQLMEAMLEWIKTCNSHFLRLLAHLVLFFRRIGRNVQDEIGDAVLEAYVKVLMGMRSPQLVAFYVAALPQEDQVTLYAQFLEGVTESNERRLCLTVAEEAGLDVFTITKTVVENIRSRECTNDFPDLHAALTPKDEEMISALDWVVFYDSQCTELIWQANAMIRQFLTVRKLEAARKAFNKVPVDSIDIIIRQYLPSESDDSSNEMSAIQFLPQRVASSIREYLCHRAYLDAQEGFSDWFHHYHNAKPQEPVIPSGDTTFTERVSFQHRNEVYKMELERWKISMQQQTKTVKSQLLNVLSFPEGGWLVDVASEKGFDEQVSEHEEEENKCRHQQMENLRQLCIPEVVLLLINLLESAGEHTQCIQIADLVVSEQFQLYKVYTAQKLGELLKKLCQSVRDLVVNTKDPFGHV